MKEWKQTNKKNKIKNCGEYWRSTSSWAVPCTSHPLSINSSETSSHKSLTYASLLHCQPPTILPPPASPLPKFFSAEGDRVCPALTGCPVLRGGALHHLIVLSYEKGQRILPGHMLCHADCLARCRKEATHYYLPPLLAAQKRSSRVSSSFLSKGIWVFTWDKEDRETKNSFGDKE